MAQTAEELTTNLYDTVILLKKYLGRMPTEEEVYDFVFGNELDRARILATSQE